MKMTVGKRRREIHNVWVTTCWLNYSWHDYYACTCVHTCVKNAPLALNHPFNTQVDKSNVLDLFPSPNVAVNLSWGSTTVFIFLR